MSPAWPASFSIHQTTKILSPCCFWYSCVNNSCALSILFLNITLILGSLLEQGYSSSDAFLMLFMSNLWQLCRCEASRPGVDYQVLEKWATFSFFSLSCCHFCCFFLFVFLFFWFLLFCLFIFFKTVSNYLFLLPGLLLFLTFFFFVSQSSSSIPAAGQRGGNCPSREMENIKYWLKSYCSSILCKQKLLGVSFAAGLQSWQIPLSSCTCIPQVPLDRYLL